MLLHFVLVLHFAAILITFCVNITFCGDYYISRRNKTPEIKGPQEVIIETAGLDLLHGKYQKRMTNVIKASGIDVRSMKLTS